MAIAKPLRQALPPLRTGCRFLFRRVVPCVAAAGAALAIASGVDLIGTHAQSATTPAPQEKSSLPPPGSTAMAAAPSVAQPQTLPSTPADAHRLQIANQCASLLQMATDLKTEVDKSTKDTLSVSVVRKANEIEQFAHKVRAANPDRP